MRAKVAFHEGVQAQQRLGIPFEIVFLDDAFNPDIHRERAIVAAGKEEDAVSDLAADTRELHQTVSSLIDPELGQGR
jgi:hypothetical protein